MANTPESYDLVIVGGGPAGLAAAIAAQSEHINTVLIDCLETGTRPMLGGQAATTSCIKNYPGFPGGISGDELMANFVKQATEFGTTFEVPLRADKIVREDDRVGI